MMEGFYWKKTNCQAVLVLASVMCAIIFQGECFFLCSGCVTVLGGWGHTWSGAAFKSFFLLFSC